MTNASTPGEFRPQRYDQINLVVVDVQNDFCPGGSLAVDEGDLVVTALNRIMDTMVKNRPSYSSHGYFEGYIDQQIIATRDWHPEVTGHFDSNPDFKETWPQHCVANTTGAAFHDDLELAKHHRITRVVSKGTKVDEAGYSGFDGKTDLGIPMRELLSPSARRAVLMVGGLATDYCVRATVLDARNLGFDTYVIEDAIRGVAPETTAQAIREMKAAGAVFVTSDDIVAAYERA